MDAGVLPEGVTSRIESKQDENGSEMIFSELFEKFLAHKVNEEAAEKEERKPLSKRGQSEHRRYFKVLLEIMGEMSVLSITKQAVKEGLLTYRQLPQRNKNPYNKLPVSELLEMEIPIEDIVASKTIIEARKTLQGIFRYAVDENIIDASPSRDLNLKLESKSTFAPYTKAEVRMMLAACQKESTPWKKWLPLLAAYTGARRGELVQLRKEDVKLDSDSDRFYILITDEAGSIKTDNAKRQVPLHKTLEELGFIMFVKSANDRLFDEIKPQAVTGWFARFRHNLKIERFDDFGNRKVFHSFRHTFVTQSRSGNSLEQLQQVVGHEKTNAGITDRYSHRLPVADVLGVVDKVSYK
jgi:integrase